MPETQLKTRIESVRARLDAEPGKAVRIVRARSRRRSGFESEASAGKADLDRLREAVDRHCPVLDDLRRPVPVTLELRNRR